MVWQIWMGFATFGRASCGRRWFRGRLTHGLKIWDLDPFGWGERGRWRPFFVQEFFNPTSQKKFAGLEILARLRSHFLGTDLPMVNVRNNQGLAIDAIRCAYVQIWTFRCRHSFTMLLPEDYGISSVDQEGNPRWKGGKSVKDLIVQKIETNHGWHPS